MAVGDLFENVPPVASSCASHRLSRRRSSASWPPMPPAGRMSRFNSRSTVGHRSRPMGLGDLRSAATAVFGQEVGHSLLELPELDESAAFRESLPQGG